jgi:hypothetical protein
VEDVLLALLAELLQFQTRLERLLVLRGVVVEVLALRTLELDEIVLGHIWGQASRLAG